MHIDWGGTSRRPPSPMLATVGTVPIDCGISQSTPMVGDTQGAILLEEYSSNQTHRCDWLYPSSSIGTRVKRTYKV
ncbi:hypothetical protein Y032_0028g1676 [Ancylostoma ceylanicum]|uniref:Uncharacterized protein n=1 Tax=Ancylostoma ceylanicum TaxID=53326 RepID=A0A016USF5_9BILA|nr:hypothetical protein Y032_0028g1676 [Ancylostoma ceylanicum]